MLTNVKISEIFNHLAKPQLTKGKSLEKSTIKLLLGLAQSDCQRKCIRNAVMKAGNLSQTQARHKYGFENMNKCVGDVESAIAERKTIHEAIDSLVQTQDQALLASLGIDISDSDSSEESGDEQEELVDLPPETDIEAKPAQDVTVIQSESIQDIDITLLIRSCNFNCFEFVERLQSCRDFDTVSVTDVFSPTTDFSQNEQMLITQSYEAFQASESASAKQRKLARCLNGEIVSDSCDSDDGYCGVSELQNPSTIALIKQKRRAIRHRAKRLEMKAVAEKRFLSRKVSKRTNNIVSTYPDIGKTIESYVQDHSVGADAWRRTGVLTFVGNVQLQEKVTFQGIRQHLSKVYGRNFSYGTTVELCIPRNKRRSSAKRYKAVAKVTTRRARKGFNIRYNPDSHWSTAFYKGLNKLQYVDGRDMLNINRDDAAGFRLDTLTTCNQFAVPCVKGSDVLTTRTDYVNKYPSTLQTTSYSLSGTDTTEEFCAGIVKAPKLHFKNPAQHASDLNLLEKKTPFETVFTNTSTGCAKSIECIRVDGAVDEGPSHEEVRYWWTKRHLLKGLTVTIVTSRSGSSYMNRVELQNGCLSRGHANTFIPSTLAGSNTDPETGMLNEERLKANMNFAIDAYINRVDQCPCGGTVINLYKGEYLSAETVVEERTKFLTFLKGSKKARLKFKQENPELNEMFEKIMDVKRRHMVPGLPAQYCFFLRCCYQPSCPHPICKKGKPDVLPLWYPGGPPVSHLPLPVIDITRPSGNLSCESCKDECCGHYDTSTFTDTSNKEKMKLVVPVPSVLIKQEFSKQKVSNDISSSVVQNCARLSLLSCKEVNMWIAHLQEIRENRKRGAVKAAATRRSRSSQRNKKDTEYFCGTCGVQYEDEMDNVEFWVCCDSCGRWYCCNCEGLLETPGDEECYNCTSCQQCECSHD